MGRASTSQSQVRGQHNLITPDTKCAACSNPLGTGRFMKHPVSLRPLHPSCFKCVICDKPIAGQFCVSRESENAFLVRVIPHGGPACPPHC